MATKLTDIIDFLNRNDIDQAERMVRNISNRSERTKASKLVATRKSLMSKAGSAAKKAIGAVTNPILAFDASNKALMQQNLALAANVDQLEKLNQQTLSLKLTNISLQASFSELNGGMLALEKTMGARMAPGFDKMRTKLGQQVLIWGRFGVGINESAHYMNEFNTTLGMSPDQIGNFGRQLQAFAVGTGQSFGDVLKDFNYNLNDFAGILDGQEMSRQMMLISASSKRMGMSISDSVGALRKFDTVQGALAAGSKINQTVSALGGSFDSMLMAAMDQPEQLKYIAKTVQQVMPKIKAASPRAQRLYMKSLADGFGLSVTQVRKMANFKSEGGLSLERGLSAGQLPQAISSGEERKLARGMLTASDFSKANLTGLARETAQASLLRAGGAAGLPTTTLVPRALNALTPQANLLDKADQVAVMGGKALRSYLDTSGMTKNIKGLVGKLEPFIEKVDGITKMLDKRLTAMEHRKPHR